MEGLRGMEHLGLILSADFVFTKPPSLQDRMRSGMRGRGGRGREKREAVPTGPGIGPALRARLGSPPPQDDAPLEERRGRHEGPSISARLGPRVSRDGGRRDRDDRSLSPPLRR